MKRLLLSVSLFSFAVAGCQEPAATDPATATNSSTEPTHDHGDHAHPSEGPHHGDLVELGDEEFHGEVVHDDEAKTLTVYILDSAATEQVAIEAAELTINISHDGNPEQFTLAAVPEENDDNGKSSRFVSSEQELMKHLDNHDTKAQLVVKIEGKSYRGDIHHSHDHESHDHAH